MELEEMLEDLGSEDLIFHYTSLDTFYCHILKDGTLFFSGLKRKNDPHEFIKLNNIGYQQSYLLSEQKIAEQYAQSTISGIDDLWPKVRFASFCRNDFQDTSPSIDRISQFGCCRMRMWTQYAGNHTGVCIVFSKTKLLEAVKRELMKKEGTYIAPQLRDIQYVDFWEFAHYYPFDVSYRKERDYMEIARNYYLGINSPLVVKDNDFSDECETRILYLSDTLEYVDCMDAMVGVVFGLCTTDDERNYMNHFDSSRFIKQWRITSEHDLPDIERL